MSDEEQQKDGDVVDMLEAIRNKKREENRRQQEKQMNEQRARDTAAKMDDQSSGLPPIDDVREQNTMRVYRISTYKMRRWKVETNLVRVNESTTPKSQPVYATVIEIDDERVQSFIPSKVIATGVSETNFQVVFYVNTSLPQTARPFKGKTYLMFFIPDQADVIEYDVNVRFFMDQVPELGYPGGGAPRVIYVMMFDQKAYDELIVRMLEK